MASQSDNPLIRAPIVWHPRAAASRGVAAGVSQARDPFAAAAHRAPELDVLNIGCGRKARPGAVNLDISREVGADVVHDLNRTPWPFPSGQFREVHAYDVLEHLDDVIRAMGEIHRICQPKAIVHITVPHFSSGNAYTDLTHQHYFGCDSLRYFEPDHELAFYSVARFHCRTVRLTFYPTLTNKLVWRLANRRPQQYERRWAWIFPAWYLYFELEALK